MSRRVAVLFAVGALIAVGVAGALGVALGDESPAIDSRQFRGSKPPARIAMSDFSLRNYDGRPIRSRDLRGRVTLLTFLDSQCTESCPVIAWTVARAFDALDPAERKDVRAVAISTDPAEDTPKNVRRFLARNRALGRLVYVGGGESERELRRVWTAFRVLSSLESGEDALHSAPVRIYDRGGTWVSTLHAGADLTETNLVHDIRVALGPETATD